MNAQLCMPAARAEGVVLLWLCSGLVDLSVWTLAAHESCELCSTALVVVHQYPRCVHTWLSAQDSTINRA
jgi:hypothetical protein